MQTNREDLILWEGPCAYATKTGAGYGVYVFSTNSVTHVLAGTVAPDNADRAETLVRRLNAYPDKTRKFHGLL